jgi:hypothetical protein
MPEAVLKHTLTYSGKYIIVDDNAAFPDRGLLRIGPLPPEGSWARITKLFTHDPEGFWRVPQFDWGRAGSRQGQWSAGSSVVNSAMAEHHNAIKRCSVERPNADLGTVDFPADGSLNFI